MVEPVAMDPKFQEILDRISGILDSITDPVLKQEFAKQAANKLIEQMDLSMIEEDYNMMA